ncbi:MAG: fibronectin type III domain-containing protein [Candidatus Nitrosotalea sp.]|nr:fibronectin type III domain-containing protein [Candidatus Nitrosotalea sp.]
MNKNGPYLIVLLSVIAASVVIPAYAEVTSLQIDSSFYKGGSVIHFSGTTLSTDSPNVTIVIFDPNGKFLSLVSGITDSNHAFQVSVDTSTQSNMQLFSVKGVYNATAFIANQAAGKTVNFVVSPDGSPAFPSPPTNLVATPASASEVDLSWTAPQNNGGLSITGYQIERNDGSGFNVIANSPTTTYQDKNMVPNPEHSYRVSAINSAGSSVPSNIAPVMMPSSPTPAPTQPNTQNITSSPDQNSTQPQMSIDQQIQERIAAANKLQELLNGQQSSPSSTQSNPASSQQQNSQQTIQLNESIGVNDNAANLGSKKSNSMSANNLTLNKFANFDIKTILYPAISLIGVGIVVAILYSRKKRKLGTVVRESKEAHLPVEQTFEKKDEDYALTILKNRLAKGEITVDEFKKLKDELSEP